MKTGSRLYSEQFLVVLHETEKDPLVSRWLVQRARALWTEMTAEEREMQIADDMVRAQDEAEHD